MSLPNSFGFFLHKKTRENDTYESSGVNWTGSSVNSGGKLCKSRSDSKVGR